MSLLNKDYTSSDGEIRSEDDQITGGAQASKSIFGHLFVFDTPYKNDILNVLQYSFISLIPLVALTRFIQYIIPEASHHGGSLEIVMEVIGQVSLLVIGLILVHRFTTYFSTYSGEPYPQHSIICFVLGMLVVLISLHSRLGDKINILVDRVYDKWNGTSSEYRGHHKKHHGHHKKNHSNQPLPDVQVMDRPVHPSYADTTQISNLPVISQTSNMPVQHTTERDRAYGQSAQSYSLAYDMPSTSGGNNMDAGMQMNEPTAANGVLGSSFGSVW